MALLVISWLGSHVSKDMAGGNSDYIRVLYLREQHRLHMGHHPHEI